MKRDSNIELLRIVAMIFIVIFHISIHAQGSSLVTHPYITGIACTGVNLFILISGYFGIRLKWRSLLNIVAVLVFFNALTLASKCVIYDYKPVISDIGCLILPVSHSWWWFARNYLILMLLSPAINLIIEKSSKKQILYIIGVLAYFSCVSGYLFENSVNKDGFNLFNFVFIYMIGSCIKRYMQADRIKTTHLAVTYTMSTAALIVYHHFYKFPSYNNPVLIIAAVSLFGLFLKMKSHNSPAINSIAQCMFPVYLLQDSPLGFDIYRDFYAYGAKQNFEGSTYVATLVIYTVSLFALAIVLEKTRLWLMSKPIERASNYLKAKCNIFDE